MAFENWLERCTTELMDRLRCDRAHAQRIIEGVGVAIYRRQFERGLSPAETIDRELCYWND